FLCPPISTVFPPQNPCFGVVFMTHVPSGHISPTPVPDPAGEEKENRSATLIVVAFPAFILIGAIAAFLFPATFAPLTNYINLFLSIIMFTMGLTLTVPDFQMVLKRPLPVFIGVVAQFVIMPVLAVLVAKMMGLNPALAVGQI